MRFKQYLTEQVKNSRHMLTYQKLLMALDKAHISKEENHYEFNLGSVVKDSSLKGLNVRIQKADGLDVKLGKHKDGRYFIVIDVKKLPERLKIDTMMSTNEGLMNRFIDCLADYYNNFRSSEEEITPTKQEKRESLYKPENFEENYDKLIKALDGKVQEYRAALADLDKNEKYNVNMFKKASLQEAKKKLREDYFGNNEKEFIKKAYKLPEAEFVTYLEKEVEKKLAKRLENYYDQKIG